MRINNNIMAMNAHRQLAVNQTNASKSMEKLSSGLRITRAGDDAAGLAISEKMRGQIRGLKMAARNAQDGISLIQTAEGALNETHAILQRMRELATQASTDTNTLTDRKEIQKEINQLLDEIDRIGNQTEFNTQKLLDGTYSGKVFHIGANEGQNMKIDITDMRTTAIGGGIPGKDAVDPEPGVKASGELGGLTFTAVNEGEAGNEIEIVFANPGSNNASLGIEVEGTKITVNLATDDSGAIKSTATEIANAITQHSGASALVEVSGTGDTPVTAGAKKLEGGADGVPGSDATPALGMPGGSIADLRVANVDDVTEDELDGLANAGVLTQKGADSAITNVNIAIEQVSAERSKLGAIQNRLEHTIANLGTSAENLQAAESRIRDLDMAEEIMAFTKNNILQQAATAMLAQANMAPQSVLQLLG
jgi:flagellin